MRQHTFLLVFSLAGFPLTALAQHPGRPHAGASQMQPAPHQQQQPQMPFIHPQHQQMMMQQNAMEQQLQFMMFQQQQRMLQQQQKRQQNASQASQSSKQQSKSAASVETPVDSVSTIKGTKAPNQATKPAIAAATTSVNGAQSAHVQNDKHAARTRTTTKTHVAPARLRFLAWPDESTAAYRNLMRLKAQLDGIGMGSTPTQNQVTALHQALLDVANSPRPPTVLVRQLSNNLATALSTREAPVVDTRVLAFQLRAIMNSAHLAQPDIQQTIIANRELLIQSEVTPVNVGTVAHDLETIADDFVAEVR
jgi:hypothetical protein